MNQTGFEFEKQDRDTRITTVENWNLCWLNF